jgi:GntR family transcriptional regulator
MVNQARRHNLSDQVAKSLLEELQAGAFGESSYLPSLEKLAARFGVGRTTIREAVSSLQALGYLHVSHGRGIRALKAAEISHNCLETDFQRIERLGLKPSSRLLFAEIGSASAEVARDLNIHPDDPVCVVRCLRLGSGEPMCIACWHFSASRVPDLLERDLNRPLWEILAQHYGVVAAYSKDTVAAVLPSREEARLLKIRERNPVLAIDSVVFDRTRSPFESSHTLYRAERFKYVAQSAAGISDSFRRHNWDRFADQPPEP